MTAFSGGGRKSDIACHYNREAGNSQKRIQSTEYRIQIMVARRQFVQVNWNDMGKYDQWIHRRYFSPIPTITQEGGGVQGVQIREALTTHTSVHPVSQGNSRVRRCIWHLCHQTLGGSRSTISHRLRTDPVEVTRMVTKMTFGSFHQPWLPSTRTSARQRVGSLAPAHMLNRRMNSLLNKRAISDRCKPMRFAPSCPIALSLMGW